MVLWHGAYPANEGWPTRLSLEAQDLKEGGLLSVPTGCGAA